MFFLINRSRQTTISTTDSTLHPGQKRATIRQKNTVVETKRGTSGRAYTWMCQDGKSFYNQHPSSRKPTVGDQTGMMKTRTILEDNLLTVRGLEGLIGDGRPQDQGEVLGSLRGCQAVDFPIGVPGEITSPGYTTGMTSGPRVRNVERFINCVEVLPLSLKKKKKDRYMVGRLYRAYTSL